jgi:predicted tellurium resistance membrane protein TerC
MTILDLLLIGLSLTLVDVDNAMVTTGEIQRLAQHRQRRAMILVLAGEFAGRIGLIILFTAIISGDQPLFFLFGRPVTMESLSLFIAGTYLVANTGRELLHLRQSAPDRENSIETGSLLPVASYPRFMGELILVNIIMSVDTVLVLLNMSQPWSIMLILLGFSALVRLLFVDQLVRVTRRFPLLNFIILFLLLFIGLELLGQGLGFDVEAQFNLLVLVVLGLIILYVVRRSRPEAAVNAGEEK